MDKPKNDETPIRVYGTTWYYKLATFMFIFLFLVGVTLLKDYAPLRDYLAVRCGWPLGILFMVYLCVIFLIDGTQQHLAIYETGLEHRQGTIISFAKWENLSHFGNLKGFPCIISNALIEQRGGRWFEKFHVTSLNDDVIRLPQECGVPIHFVKDKDGKVDRQVNIEMLLTTDFGRDLLHYAPHLFEYGREKAKNS